jgi:hypothetical protein
MAKASSFTIKHYLVNEFLELDLQDHLDHMSKTGWGLNSARHLMNEHSATTPQMIFFWGRDEEN